MFTWLAPFLAVSLSAQIPPPEQRPIAKGPFQPNWDSLLKYNCPEWFRDAKFGIWAHWSAQCVPEDGDWYARNMYIQGSGQYDYQLAHYGHPSKVGFKDIDHMWHAEHWEPEKLIALYKKAGAKYFVALANHHDNFDTWNSKYQPWNSVNIGPHKDIVGTWAKAARAAGLHFGVTVHAARSWDWFDVSHDSDKTGSEAGVPYDGNLTKADGKGQWWDGYNPADLYSPAGAARTPEAHAAYVTKFFNRVKDLVDSYHPDLLYFDDSVSPLGDTGLAIYAHYYNANMSWHHGKEEGILNAKGMPKRLVKSLVHDYERGRSNKIEPYPWQTDTCIGDWHYDRKIFLNHTYKKASEVIPNLVDIVSKNGNLLLNIPVRGDGSIDEDEVQFLHQMAGWMNVNSECIFGTRPWTIPGEGPVTASGDMGAKPFTGEDFRFTQKNGAIYAVAMSWPGSQATIKSLAASSPYVSGEVQSVSLLGAPAVKWHRDAEGLHIDLPQQRPCDYAYAFKITGLKTLPPPPEPAAPTIAPRADGSLVLEADAANLHGDTLQVESQGDVRDIGYWDDASQFASWDQVHVARPGTYELWLKYAGPYTSNLAINIGGQTITSTLPPTGDYTTFRDLKMGSVQISAAGTIQVTAKPANLASWKAINLSSIALKPTG